MTEIRVKAFCNADDVHLVWDHDEDIPGCLGFAIQCQRGDRPPAYISNRVGFEDDHELDDAGIELTKRSSRIWPFQRYNWTDHAADLGNTIAYRIVARVVGDNGKLRDGPASKWTKALNLSADCGDGVSVHFNRGYVLSQFMARYMKRKGITLAELKREAVVVSEQVDRPARAFLGGTLREAMLGIMKRVEENSALELHAALYELEDEELVDGLAALEGRAHVVLANGSVDNAGDDQNAHARERLNEAGCVVHDRFLAPKALGHNKFLVVGRPGGNGFAAELVWTGSTNWTPTGLCTQLNNGILIDNAKIARVFERQFNLLAEAGDGISAELKAANNQPTRGLQLGGAKADCWFTRLDGSKDINELVALVEGAKKGIFFIMFQPGSEPVKTLLRIQAEKGIYVRGVATQFTGDGAEKFRLLKEDPETYFLDSAQASGVGRSVGEWAVEGTASDFRKHIGHAITHSKTIVIDPFSDDPIVITGSHNFSKAASSKNDENFLIIRGHKQIAVHYAINAMQTYNHYRWRAYLEESAREGRSAFAHLSRDPKWQRRRTFGENKRMLDFWMR